MHAHRSSYRASVSAQNPQVHRKGRMDRGGERTPLAKDVLTYLDDMRWAMMPRGEFTDPCRAGKLPFRHGLPEYTWPSLNSRCTHYIPTTMHWRHVGAVPLTYR